MEWTDLSANSDSLHDPNHTAVDQGKSDSSSWKTTANETEDKSQPIKSNKQECMVCGDTSSGIHFGVFTCEGCKGFFKRACASAPLGGLLRHYSCALNNECTVDINTRNNCKACRLNKCIRQGMSKQAIKLGRRRKKPKNTSRKLKYSTLANNQVIQNTCIPHGINQQTFPLTNQNHHLSAATDHIPNYCHLTYTPVYDSGHYHLPISQYPINYVTNPDDVILPPVINSWGVGEKSEEINNGQHRNMFFIL